MATDSRNDDDDGFEEGDEPTSDRARWLAILERYDIPIDTWAAHMAWVNSYHSWREAEQYAQAAQQAWEEYKAGVRHDWVV